eukprot:gene433-94_t
MAGTGQGYDLDPTTYSPDGRIFQIDYAQKCVDNAPTTLAICCKDGVVLASMKVKLSKMLVQGTNKKCFAISRNLGCTFTGLTPDGRYIMDIARSEEGNYKKMWGEKIPGYRLAERIGHTMHLYTCYWSARPVGVSFLIGHYDKGEKPTVFCIEPSGQVTKWFGKALGKGRQLANTEIEKLDLANLTCKESLFHVCRILHKCADEGKTFELEVNWISSETNYEHQIVPAELLAEAEERAKRALEDEDDD